MKLFRSFRIIKKETSLSHQSNSTSAKAHFVIRFFSCVVLLVTLVGPLSASAQLTPETNPSNEGFKLVVCDGPTLPEDVKKTLPTGTEFKKRYGHDLPYVPCNFQTAMAQIQHLINIMLVVGVLAAVAGFTYAGALYISGSQEKIKKARSIFPKVFGGFVLMLSAWFIVFEIMRLLGNGAGTALLK